MTTAANIVNIDGGRVRLSNDELHRRASKAIYESNHIVFESLPGLIAQIIENKIWEGYNHSSFADYALDAGSNGIGINSNQRLWLLRCAMDVHGKHIQEWTEVIAKVDEMVKQTLVQDGKTVRSIDGNSLEALAKKVGDISHGPKITYLPSRSRAGFDRDILRLRKNNPDAFNRVLEGEITARKAMTEARKAAGIKNGNESNLVRAKSAINKLTDEEREALIEWLRSEGFIE